MPAPVYERLAALRRHAGPPRDLWIPLAEALADLAAADRCLLALRTPGAAVELGRLADVAPTPPPSVPNGLLNGKLVEFIDRLGRDGALIEALGGHDTFAIGLRLPLLQEGQMCAAILLLARQTRENAEAALARLRLVEDTVRLSQERQAARENAAVQQRLAETLDTLALVQDQTRFYAASLALCNGLADRLRGERVSLGWIHGPSIRLRAVSRTERINRQMELAQGLESLMEEAVDQDLDLLFPAADSPAILRQHTAFAQQHHSPHLATLLLRAGPEIVGALTLERAASPWEPGELHTVRLALDLATRRLQDLQRYDRWFGARWAAWWKEQAGRLVGYRHTTAKVVGLAVFIALLLLIFLKVPHRIEGSFSLRSEQLAHLSAPFEGYLGQAYVRPGDVVTNRQALVQLDIRDLVLEEAAADAEVQRYQREVEKARANRALGEMRVAEALMQQSSARLRQLRNRLEQATLRSPLDGVVIEGDLHERLGQPVRQGDALLRVAKLDHLYVEAAIPERDIQELHGAEPGEIAFLSQPALKFPVRGRVLEPAAVTHEGGNVFLYRCELTQPAETWFRPGMQGVAKIDVGRRRLLWILLHRTVDFLRLHLWW